MPHRRIILLSVALLALHCGASAGELRYKERWLPNLSEAVRQILRRYDPATGRFNDGVWICDDQERMYPLAVAYATPGTGNAYYKSRELLPVIVKAGQALIDDMDPQGRWMFRKKDNSTWGMEWKCWVYSRWIRTFALIRDDMPPDARAAWSKALTLGYTNISRSCVKTLHNIPTHHAMGLWQAGEVFDRPERRRQAAEHMQKIIAAQAEAGYWSEGGGPVVEYNFVYVEALGLYYAMSKDQRVLPALEKAAAYHYHFTYPDGRNVETIDQRNPYQATVARGHVGFTFSPIGRTYLQRQWNGFKPGTWDADLLASLILYGEEGPMADLASEPAVFTLQDGGVPRAAIDRRGPWFFCLSAYTTPPGQNRWHQDRQNFVSIFHDQAGLILGGGNTKLQPAWSNFTVGDVRLLSHTPGDTNPNFLPPEGRLYHVPSKAALIEQPELGLDLTYGPERCQIRLRPIDAHSLQYHLEATMTSGLPVAGHLTLMPHIGAKLETGGGQKIVLGTQPIDMAAAELGGSLTYAGYRLTLPATATLHWPRLPHNPYTKDGHAQVGEGRIEIALSFDAQHRAQDVRLEVLPKGQK